MAMRSINVCLCLLILGLSAPDAISSGAIGGATIATTRHNLSSKGAGPVRAAVEEQICVFCHAPHSSSPIAPLWNRGQPGTTYTPYSSSTAVASPGQPTGSSILCLSCHDGTIALGDVISRTLPITMTGGITTMPTGTGRLGTDLSDDHPISFEYTSQVAASRGELVDPGLLTGGPLRLDRTGQLQCTTCHDAHNDSYGKFLVMPNSASALCTACHVKNYWSSSSHRTSTSRWNAIGPDPWPKTDGNTVRQNACENCHTSHSAGSRERILLYEVEESNCTACHNGNVARTDIEAELSKTSRHDVMATTGIHDPSEPAEVQSSHVECVDCHEPHAVSATGLGGMPGSLNNVRGVDLSRGVVKPISAQHELCFRCHADSPDRPPARTARVLEQTNVRLEFERNGPSSHPVAGPGRNPDVPSLIAPLTESSTMECGRCHNNDTAAETGGAGPEGPHGSIYAPILVRRYETQDFTAENATRYALCYNCHDRNSILGDASFKGHNKHVVGENTPCNVCHDPHGISATQATSSNFDNKCSGGRCPNNTHLINFDTSVVFPNSQGRLGFEDRGSRRGSCYLDCHGKDHDDEAYQP